MVRKRAAGSANTAEPQGSSPAAVGFAVREGEDPWSPEEIDEVVTELRDQRDRLSRLLHDQEAELAGLMRDAGDGAGLDQADLGTTSFERDQELTVVNSERDTLLQVEQALANIDRGTFGVCEGCGEAVGKLRMMAFPRATMCLACKRREERH